MCNVIVYSCDWNTHKTVKQRDIFPKRAFMRVLVVNNYTSRVKKETTNTWNQLLQSFDYGYRLLEILYGSINKITVYVSRWIAANVHLSLIIRCSTNNFIQRLCLRQCYYYFTVCKCPVGGPFAKDASIVDVYYTILSSINRVKPCT